MILRRKPLTLMTAIIIVIGVAAVTTTTGAYAQLSPPSSSQQNMTSLNATNATAVVAINNTTAATAPTPTRIITQLLGVRGEVIPLHMENIQFQQEDPLFAKLVQVINDCMNFVVAQQQKQRFFAESLWAPPKIKNVQKLDPMVITPRSRVWNPFGITNNAKHINQSHLT